MSEKKYMINQDLVIRDEDRALFSLSKMEIYKFNEEGYEILKFIYGEPVDYNEIYNHSTHIIGQNKDYLDAFLEKMLDNDIIQNVNV